MSQTPDGRSVLSPLSSNSDSDPECNSNSAYAPCNAAIDQPAQTAQNPAADRSGPEWLTDDRRSGTTMLHAPSRMQTLHHVLFARLFACCGWHGFCNIVRPGSVRQFAHYRYLRQEFGLVPSPLGFGFLLDESHRYCLFVARDGVYVFSYRHRVAQLLARSLSDALLVLRGYRRPDGNRRLHGAVYDPAAEDQSPPPAAGTADAEAATAAVELLSTAATDPPTTEQTPPSEHGPAG
ncbi:hypothetical protein BZA05DRAFT_438824 [Tricharina praecox]|uniref:uncharacterized protein n=1 Tax=Tricharina praecox TaxID=43433 RepID=UPI00221F14CC|nr:uncharacterized protein BZA05DRAFT_438824 [Tricharina praecox]KAI5844762.1 hypothetical protein BZA05DRAFT_438824 [Tricharina praecox]